MLSFMKYLDPTADPLFWKEVENRHENDSQYNNEDINTCMLEVRAERITKEFSKQGKDPIFVMINDWYEEYQTSDAKNIEFSILQMEIIAIAELIIKREYSSAGEKPHLCPYSQHFITDESTGIAKTLLHEIANSNKASRRSDLKGKHLNKKKDLVPIARQILRFDPSLVYATTEGEELEKLPVEFALLNYDDDMASFLIDSMDEKKRVRMLFEHDYSRDVAPRFKFSDFISKPEMKKTVLAVLDSLMSPNLPMLFSDGLPNSAKTPTSMQCEYYFRILDGDLQGRRPCIFKDSIDEKFNWHQMSCLQTLCMSSFSEMSMKHPVVRHLARRKWAAFGRLHVRLHFAVYLMFLLAMSVALIGSCYEPSYRTTFGKLVLFTESVCFAYCLAYFGLEIDQFCREKKYYFYDAFNYLDLLGIWSLLLTIFLRWSENSQYGISSLSFILNFIRVFKFLAAFRSTGLYLATLSTLMKDNLPNFIMVYAVILLGFSGSFFIASQGSVTASARLDFEDVLFRKIRGLAEGQVFDENYSNFGAWPIILILGGSMISSLILANILIAQLSESYTNAKNNAVLQYDIAKLQFVLRIENSRWKYTCLRLKHYQESVFANNEDL